MLSRIGAFLWAEALAEGLRLGFAPCWLCGNAPLSDIFPDQLLHLF